MSAVPADYFAYGLCLFSGTAMTEADLARIVGIVRSMAKLGRRGWPGAIDRPGQMGYNGMSDHLLLVRELEV